VSESAAPLTAGYDGTMSLPDHTTLLGYIKANTPLKVTFTGGDTLIAKGDLPADGTIDRVVFTNYFEELAGLSLKSDHKGVWFFTNSCGRFHPKLTSVEPIETETNP
jgi:hypothetical protein